jgi:ABC-type transporter Mla MlaB component
MLKITALSTSNSENVLKLEGKLLEPWIEELEHSADREIESKKPLQLDLSGLHYADVPGMLALHRLIRRGATVVASSGFIATLLGRVDDE